MKTAIIILQACIACSLFAQNNPCSGKSYNWPFLFILENPSSIDDVPGTDKSKAGEVIAAAGRTYSLYMTTICSPSPYSSGYPNSYCYDFEPGYWPVRISIEECELDNLQNVNNECCGFEKEDAYACMQAAVLRYNSICSSASKEVVLNRNMPPQSGVIPIRTSNDPNLFPTKGTLGVFVVVNGCKMLTDDVTGDIVMVQTPILKFNGSSEMGMFFRTDNQTKLDWMYSTSCPCSPVCANYPNCYYYCNIFQHELGHGLGLYHLVPGCPSTTPDPLSIMNEYQYPANTAITPSDPPCNLAMTIDDRCYYCIRNCPTGCSALGFAHAKNTEDQLRMDIFPQPSRKCVNIAIRGMDNTDYNVKIYDELGKTVKSFVYSKGMIYYGVQQLDPGLYIIIAVGLNGQMISKKLIVS